jgi:hypothetical protein
MQASPARYLANLQLLSLHLVRIAGSPPLTLLRKNLFHQYWLLQFGIDTTRHSSGQ